MVYHDHSHFDVRWYLHHSLISLPSSPPRPSYRHAKHSIIDVNKTMISSGRKDAALNPNEEALLQALRQALESSKPIPPNDWIYAEPCLKGEPSKRPVSDI